MSHFLVTGGCGFVGSHLVEALVAAGHLVRVLDDLSSGHRENLPAGVEVIVGDVADARIVQAAVTGVDGCFHLAAIASVARGETEWLATHRANQTGTITLFDAIRARTDGRRVPVVYASSAAVYGNRADMPITEEAPCQPLSAYGADKLGSELHAAVAAHVHGIPSMGLRFFNVFGPRQDPFSPYSGVISIFCNRLRKGQGIAIHGDGGQTRDFIYVADVVAALVAAMAKAGSGPAVAQVLNVCTGRATTIMDLARGIARLCGTELVVTHGPARAGDIRRSTGCPARLRRELGLGEPHGLEAGLAEVLRWLAGQDGSQGDTRRHGNG